MPRAVSIRGSLLASIIAMIILLSAAIIVVAAVGSRRTVARLSGTIIVQTNERVEERLRRFFDPLNDGLLIARGWGGSGLLDFAQPDRIRTLFEPFMREYRQTSATIIADGHGGEFMLSREGAQWTSREISPDRWGARARITTWTDDAPEPVVTWQVIDYDPRTRPWYRGAVESPHHAVHWTEPYTFFTSQQPGMTAAITFDPPGGGAVEHVIAFDVTLSDISDFTYALRPSRDGTAFVMTYEGQMIGLPRDERFADTAARHAAILTPSNELGVPTVRDGAAAFLRQAIENRDAYEFTSEGRVWWAGVTPFELGPDRLLLMAVAVPADDILGPVAHLRSMIVIITGLVLAGAVWRAMVLARRFSRPIEALVEQSRRISRGDLQPGPAIVSNVREVNRLATAQDRMRVGLASLMKLERDLQLARQIQEGTFPNRIPVPRGFRISAWSEPADETGGDTYDVIEHGDRVVLLLADATGHGIGPAISVTQVRAMLRMALRLDEDLATIVRQLNDQLHADLPEGRFITAWLGEIDPAAGTLTSFSAGQGPILRYVAAEDRCEVLPADAVPLGIEPDLDIEIADPVALADGDIVAVVSDGIYEAVDPGGTQFGVERAGAIIAGRRGESPDVIIAALREAVNEFTHGAPAEDDRTGIVIKAKSH